MKARFILSRFRSKKFPEKLVSEKGNEHGEAKRVRMNTRLIRIRGEILFNEGLLRGLDCSQDQSTFFITVLLT